MLSSMQTETKPISQYTIFIFYFFALDQLVQFGLLVSCYGHLHLDAHFKCMMLSNSDALPFMTNYPFSWIVEAACGHILQSLESIPLGVGDFSLTYCSVLK